MTALCPTADGHFNPLGLAPEGESESANSLDKLNRQISTHLRMPEYRNIYYDLILEIEDILVACANPNWDGYGARPIVKQAAEEAVRFIEALPTHAYIPEVGPDPDGDITFEWISSKRRLSVSLGGDNLIVFARVAGTSNTLYGQNPFNNEIPKNVLSEIEMCASA